MQSYIPKALLSSASCRRQSSYLLLFFNIPDMPRSRHFSGLFFVPARQIKKEKIRPDSTLTTAKLFLRNASEKWISFIV